MSPERRFALVIAVVAAAALLGTIAAQGPSVDPQGFELAAAAIRCDCGCHPQAVKDCACGRATEMRRDVAGMLAQGMTGQQVIDRYVAENGQQILLSPRATGFNLVAWLGPAVGLLLAGFAMFRMLLRWNRSTPGELTAPAAADSIDPAYRERLREALDRLE